MAYNTAVVNYLHLKNIITNTFWDLFNFLSILLSERKIYIYQWWIERNLRCSIKIKDVSHPQAKLPKLAKLFGSSISCFY